MTRLRLARAVCMLVAAGVPVALAASPTASATTLGVPSDVSVLAQPIQFLTIEGARLGYRVAGTGRPLVLIAGQTMTMAAWDPRFIDVLARKHRVIIFDNRGVGTSTGAVADLTIALMARDTDQLIAEIAHGRADVLGLSMGGYIAQRLTIDDPQRVRRLVLASTDCGGAGAITARPWAQAIIDDPDATDEQRLSVLFPPSRIGAGMAWAEAAGAAYAANNFLPDNAFAISEETVAAQARAVGPLWLRAGGGTCDGLRSITQPTFVAAGKDDVVVPWRNLKLMLQRLPPAASAVYDGAGHVFPFQPGLHFARDVSRFLLAD